jgi:hypothetical protein
VLTKMALLASSLVLVNEAFPDGLVDDRYSFLVGSLGAFRIASGNSLDDVLDIGAQHGALTCVALTAVLCLTGALTGLGRICQNLSPVPDSEEPRTMRKSARFVNNFAFSGAHL